MQNKQQETGMLLANKNVLITGGSSGIGQAIAIAFARAGANVVFTYNQNKAGATRTIDSIENNCNKKCSIKANLSNVSSIHELIDETEAFLGSIDILVNNVGVVRRSPSFLETPLDYLDDVMNVNLKVPFALIQIVAQRMKKTGNKGNIINISSLSAEVVSPGLAHYECSKAALNALTRAAASELAAFNIRVNAIAPGLVATNMNKDQWEKNTEAWTVRSSKIPLGRAGLPQDIANMALFLASDQAEWITGTIIAADGGLTVRSPFAK